MANHLKAISETDDELRVANYIVLYGGRDLEGIASRRRNADGSVGNFFTPNTKFDSPYIKSGSVFVDWEHGIEKKHDPAAPGKSDILGIVDWATAKSDEMGLWVERVLYRRNKYMRYIETLIKEGLIGNSTEATSDGVEIAPNGEIKAWAIERDTLTVNPMEPRMMTQNAITAIKSLAEEYPHLKALIPQEVGETSGGATAADTKAQPIIDIHPTEIKTMTDVTLTMQEYKDLLKAQVKAPDAPAPVPAEAQDPAMKALSDRLDHMTALIEKAPALKDAGYVAPDSEEDHAETKSFGDWLIAVRNGNTKRIKSVYKTALAEDAGATGGYLVPTQFVAPILAAAEPFSVLRRAGATVIPMSGKEAEVPSLDVTTAPSAGDTAYAGGVIAYWEGEADTLTESEPRWRLINLVAHKLAGYSLASNELRDDAAGVEAILTTMFGRAIGSKENYAFFRGDGVGKPLGIVGHGATIAASRSAASTVALADLAQMMSDLLPGSWNKAAWFINPGVLDQIIQIVSAPVSWLENARSGLPMTLLGLPLYVTGALPALNTVGDILLVDPSYYLIGDRKSVSIAYSEHYAFVTDQAAWRFTHRVDGQPWINSYITLEDAATTVSPFVSLAAG